MGSRFNSRKLGLAALAHRERTSARLGGVLSVIGMRLYGLGLRLVM